MTEAPSKEVASKAEVTAAVTLITVRIVLVLASNIYLHLWDTPSYLAAARRPLRTLLFDPYRSPAYPLLLKLVASDERWVIVIQTVVASFSWMFLAFALAAWFLDRRLRWAALLSCYALSIAGPVLQWDYILYGESLSLSLFALLAAFILRYARRRRAADLYWLALPSIAFALARDSNVLACAVAGTLVACLHPAERRARRAQSTAVVMLLIASPALVGGSLMLSARGTASTMNMIFTRVAAEPPLLNDMVVRYGMPRSAALACAGVDVWNCRHDLSDLTVWTVERGRLAYVRLLLTHPDFTARAVWRWWYDAVGGVGLQGYGDVEHVRWREHAGEPKLRAIPLVPGLGSFSLPGRAISKGCARVTFTGLIARLERSASRLLSFVPFVVLTALLVVSRAMHAGTSMLLPAVFFAAVVISHVPIILLDGEIPRHALLASVSVNHLSLYLLLVCVSLLACGARTLRAPEG